MRGRYTVRDRTSQRADERAAHGRPQLTAYCDGLEYYAFGRYYDVTPVVLQAPHEGYWYVVVVDNGNEEELGDIDAYVQAL
ncbi:DUF1883 domain-containing protein [Amycolatopsis sp. NBC_01286]|nr:DUF1883 domain-containing protein [Amycolatopsis sp. NBC_01286]